MDFELTVNGLSYVASYRDEDVRQVFKPLVDGWLALKPKNGRRAVVLLAAPPATGKSTLALVLERLAAAEQDVPRVQALGMDGFHYPNAYLDAHSIEEDGAIKMLHSRKGAPFTFDVQALRAAMGDLANESPRPWPAYSRELHDVEPNSIDIMGDILLIEGNYLLLDEPGWRDLRDLADQTVFLSADAGMLHDRLVGRKVAGGMDRTAAEAWYKASDGRNVELVLGGHLKADIELKLNKTGAVTFA